MGMAPDPMTIKCKVDDASGLKCSKGGNRFNPFGNYPGGVKGQKATIDFEMGR